MRLVHVALLCCLAACGISNSNHNQLSSDSRLPGTVVDDELAASLSGTYAVLVNLAGTQDLPLVGRISSTAQIFRLADIRKSGDGLIIKDRACRTTFRSSNPSLKISVSDASIRSLPAHTASLRVWEESGTLHFAQDPQVLVAGANLADPIRDALPVRGDDPRVVDTDRDGKPGMTSSVSAPFISGQVYFVQRSVTSYAGKQAANGDFVGLVKDKTDQVIVGASNFLLRIGAAPNVPDPDPSKANIRLVKLPAETDCDGVDFAEIFSN